jgi:hypothetical protein
MTTCKIAGAKPRRMNTCTKKVGGYPRCKRGFLAAAAESDRQIAKVWGAELEWAGSDRRFWDATCS